MFLPFYKNCYICRPPADVAKLADALDLGSSAARRVGSTPSIRTLTRSEMIGFFVFDSHECTNIKPLRIKERKRAPGKVSHHPSTKIKQYHCLSSVNQQLTTSFCHECTNIKPLTIKERKEASGKVSHQPSTKIKQ